MKQVTTDVLMTTVLAENFPYLRSEKGSGEDVLPHDYAAGFAADLQCSAPCPTLSPTSTRNYFVYLMFMQNFEY